MHNFDATCALLNIEELEMQSSSQIAARLEMTEKVDNALRATRDLYWYTLLQKPNEKQLSEQMLKIEEAQSFLVDIQAQLSAQKKCNPSAELPLALAEKTIGRKVAGATALEPWLQLEEIFQAWKNFTEVTSWKSGCAVIGSICVFLFGKLVIASWVLLLMASGNLVMRLIANQYKETDDYIRFSRNIQLFMWPFFLLAIGNALSPIISINGLPEGSFVAFLTMWLIYGELKGIVASAQVAKLPIPPYLERIVCARRNDIDPPL